MEAILPIDDDRSAVRATAKRTPGQVARLLSNLPRTIRKDASPRSSSSNSSIPTSDTNTEVSSIQTSLCPSVTTNPTTIGPSVGISVALPPSAQDPFRESLIIPKIRSSPVSVYPYGGCLISDGHYERFRVLVDIFKQNVENESKLKPYVSEIGYELKLCGRSTKEAHPSILVICSERIFGDLKDLLNSPHLKAQYAIPVRRLPIGGARSLRYRAGIDIPRFNLYFWRGTPPRTLLWKGNVAGPIKVKQPKETALSCHPWSDLTMCGSSVTSDDGSCSTLACLLEIDSAVYGLTVAHAFAHLVQDSAAAAEPRETSVNTAIEDEVVYFEDDVEYDSLEEGKSSSPPSAVPTGKNDLGPPSGQTELSPTVFVMEPDTTDTPDLDWAIVEIPTEQSRKPNFYLPAPNSRKPILLHEVAQRHPGHEREVVIVRSLDDYRLGTLLRGSSFIGGINRPGQCEVWNVALDGAHGLIKGDSGSLVVDRLNHQVYGYVVALNPLGEAYMIPMELAIAQIKKAFRTDTVSLPDPYFLVREITKNPTSGLTSSLSLASLRHALSDCESTFATREPARAALEPNLSIAEQPLDVYPPTAMSTVTSIPVSSGQGPTSTEKLESLSTWLDQPHRDSECTSTDAPSKAQNGLMAYAETAPEKWQPCAWEWGKCGVCGSSQADQIKTTTDTWPMYQTPTTNVAIFFRDPTEIEIHKHRFDRRFLTLLHSNSGGFYCDYDFSGSVATPKVSWSSFHIKESGRTGCYAWRQPSIYVEWDIGSKCQLIFIFGLNELCFNTPSSAAQWFLDCSSDFDQRQCNPFVWHTRFARAVLTRYENIYLDLKTYLQLKSIIAKDERHPAPLYDNIRHLPDSLMVAEVAHHTIKAIFREQEHWRQENSSLSHESGIAWLKARQSLLAEVTRAHSLSLTLRSFSEAHLSEMALSAARASAKDSDALKYVTFLTVLFLPGTLTASIFSTPFFAVESDTISVSKSMWFYWAAAILITLVTFLVWFLWNRRERFPALLSPRSESGANKRPDPSISEYEGSDSVLCPPRQRHGGNIATQLVRPFRYFRKNKLHGFGHDDNV